MFRWDDACRIGIGGDGKMDRCCGAALALDVVSPTEEVGKLSQGLAEK